ncbi:MAG: hypothetical protein EOO06_16500 [Chitinophagaceae bacterium]|nr:MAG: hypothetical protein EOO06_16500 [Chitinophagaceae bacterium]
MFSKSSLIQLFIGLQFFAVISTSCNTDLSAKNGLVPKDEDSAKFKDSEYYNFSQPYLINLPPTLDEISGLAYYAKDSSVFAIIDEEALLFKISLNNPEHIQQWAFGKANDYEDIILKDSVFYVLTSDGSIRSLQFKGEEIVTKKYDFITGEKKSKNEFESMYVDSGRIVILCKDCDADKKTKTSRFALDSAGGGFREIEPVHNASVAKMIDEKKVALKASAAAVHPLTGELYVVSAVNKSIYIFDTALNPREVYELNPKIYKQPEGIAFTPAGDLIISNEVYLEGNSNILVLKNKKKKQ